MPSVADSILAGLIFIVGLLYSCVGHAGASGYAAVLTLMGVPSDEKKATQLVLNILVATIGTVQFWRAGHFVWRLFWPFAVASVPMAFLGGKIRLPEQYYDLLLGAVLLFSAWRIAAVALGKRAAIEPEAHAPPIPIALVSGAALGLVSGLTGVGGGIFLSPLLLLCKWADPKTTAAVSAAFILVNSIAGMTGLLSSQHPAHLPPPSTMALLAGAAVIGGLIGSYLGSRKFDTRTIRGVLAAVLVIAGGKLVWDGAKVFMGARDGPAKTVTRRSRTSDAPAAGSPAS